MTKQGKFAKTYAAKLLRIALLDLKSARVLAREPDGRVENILLMAQQALEKSLKAVLCWREKPIPFVHDIAVLVSKLQEIPIDVPFGEQFNGLSEFATIRKYLEGDESWSEDEIEKILDEIEEALAWCHSQAL